MRLSSVFTAKWFADVGPMFQAADAVVKVYNRSYYTVPDTMQNFERDATFKVQYDTFDTIQ